LDIVAAVPPNPRLLHDILSTSEIPEHAIREREERSSMCFELSNVVAHDRLLKLTWER
jgi:hypothetical protein